MRRNLLILLLVFIHALPAWAERPRPLGWAMDAVARDKWDVAARIAARDGAVGSDVIEWLRLRKGLGTYAEVTAFLARRPDWPGEPYLRRQSEPAVLIRTDREVIGFFSDNPPQTPEGALRLAAALARSERSAEAHATLTTSWRNQPMSADTQAKYLQQYAALLAPHHAARLDAMLWRGAHSNARRMFTLVSPADQALAKARIALRQRTAGVDALIAAVPRSHADDPGLQYERFLWRARNDRRDGAIALLLELSTSAEQLGRPESWAGRRRSLARSEMREGNARQAYEIASSHFLMAGSDYADLEWLSGFIALRQLNRPQIALAHFENHAATVQSPISKGRAAYWKGRAYEAMGNITQADQSYAEGAQFQTSYYGLLAADRAGLPFDVSIGRGAQNWRNASFTTSSVFRAGMLLQASGQLDLAERFWTHLAESLSPIDAALLGQAALSIEQPHIAVMIGKRVAQRGIVIADAYYPLHPITDQNLPMAPEMLLAIARRESEFDPKVQSGVGARGLMQIMPATGREVAARLGRSAEHSTARLTTDPAYNAELGAAYLASLARRFRGNVVLMSAGYNAGPSRPDRWMQEFGDPRKANIDIVDWIEFIPFRETRNYVMRVAESLPVYRARLGQHPLPVPFHRELSGSTLLAFAPKGE